MAYLSGWDNRVELYISSDRIDENLTDFPIMLKLSESCGIEGLSAASVFTTISGNSRKVAITTSDGETQCPVEIEYWDETENKAVLWTKIPTVYSGADTKFYLYYDSDKYDNYYVGYSDDLKGQLVVDRGSEGTYDATDAYDSSVMLDGSTYKMWYGGLDVSGVWRIIYTESTGGINWTDHEMVIDVNEEGVYDTDDVRYPSVIKDGDLYKIWYQAENGSDYSIMYAESYNGTTWSGHQMVLADNTEGTNDIRIYAPHVRKEGPTYKMWYSGWDTTYIKTLYTTSSDGKNWATPQVVISEGSEGTYDDKYAWLLRVYKNDSGNYEGWYTGRRDSDDKRSIIRCTSTNGTGWTNFQKVMDKGHEGTSDSDRVRASYILVENSIYRMWYSGFDGSDNRILYTQSPDGIDWMSQSQMVWTNDYFSVHHMNQDPSSSDALDSTSSNEDLEFRNMDANDLVDGKIGQASHLDGGDDYVQSNTSGPSGNFSVEAIIKTDLLTTSQVQRVVCNNSAPNGKHFSFDIRESGGSANLSFWVDDSTANQITAISSDTPIEEGSYYYIAGTFNEGGTVKCFVDNVLKDTTVNTSFGSYSSDRDIRVGADADGLDNFFDGIIDEIRLSTTDRTQAWIKATYHSNYDDLISTAQFFPWRIEGVVYDQYGFPMEESCSVIVSELDGTFVNTGTTTASGTYNIPVARGGPDRRFIVTFYLDERYRLDENLAGAEILTSVSGTL